MEEKGDVLFGEKRKLSIALQSRSSSSLENARENTFVLGILRCNKKKYCARFKRDIIIKYTPIITKFLFPFRSHFVVLSPIHPRRIITFFSRRQNERLSPILERRVEESVVIVCRLYTAIKQGISKKLSLDHLLNFRSHFFLPVRSTWMYNVCIYRKTTNFAFPAQRTPGILNSGRKDQSLSVF